MPKKPFTTEEINAQRERIMDSAAQVMAEVGFHHLSMRKLATELGMTASNIYNYFPDKETLFLHSRRRGFELAFAALSRQQMADSARHALCTSAGQLIAFAQRWPGYYQLMLQPPLLSLQEADQASQEIRLQVVRLAEEWQRHWLALLQDAVPAMQQQPEPQRMQLALFFITSLHGLIDAYRYQSLPLLLDGVELIPDALVQNHLVWLLAALAQQAEVAA